MKATKHVVVAATVTTGGTTTDALVQTYTYGSEGRRKAGPVKVLTAAAVLALVDQGIEVVCAPDNVRVKNVSGALKAIPAGSSTDSLTLLGAIAAYQSALTLVG